MKKQISAKNTTSSQRGVALLFALGILSVLMVLGLAFVSNALIAQKISVNNSYRSQADVLAESAITRVLASTKLYSEYALFGSYQGLKAESLTSLGQADTSFNPASTKTVGTKLGDLADIAKVLGNVIDSGGTVYVNNTTFTSVGMPDPQWRLVFDSNGQVIGRYAYAVLPYTMFPQIDFTTVHSTMVTPANGITPKQMGYNVFSSPNWYSQFGLGTVTPNIIWRSYSQIFARQNVTADNQKLVRRFFEVNYPPMIEAFRTTSGTTHTYYHRFNLLRTDWSSMTVTDLLGDNAALFWTAGTKTINTGETKALPFLGRIGSDKATFADLATRRKQIAANLIDYCINDTTTSPTSDAAQPWTLASTPTYTGNKQTDYIYELGLDISLIKSNTATYTDAGFTVTPNAPANDHDVSYALGVLPVVKLAKMYKTTPASYKFINSLSSLSITGNVNKCTIEVVYEDDTLPVPVQKTATLQFDVKAHNISIDGSWTNLQPTGKMDVSVAADAFGYRVQVPAQDFTQGGIRTSNSPSINIKTKNIANLANVKAQRAEATAIVSVKLISVDELDITGVSATVGNMVLFDSAGTLGLDFVKGNLGAMSYSTTFQLASNADTSMSYKFALGSLKGIDPRQNLNAADWDNTTNVGYTKVFNAANRLEIANVMDVTNAGGGVYNGKCNTNTGANPQNLAATADFTRDRETVTSPGYVDDNTMISTAKFPASGVHAISSIAELGYIHRGAKWETINLSNANGAVNDTTTINVAAVSASLNNAGTVYADGDGGIFDMVKFIDYATVTTPEEKYYTYGKVDINLADSNGSSTPVQTLPGDYMYANWLYQPVLYYYTGDLALAASTVNAMVKVLNDNTGPRLKTRSEILINNSGNGFFNAWGGITPINKEEMDSLPCYLINTAEANPVPMVFKAIIKAQSIKDLGPEKVPPSTSYGSAAITKMINGTATSVTITKGVYDNNGDDITGEVSYLVTFVRHPVTNQFFVVDKVQITE